MPAQNPFLFKLLTKTPKKLKDGGIYMENIIISLLACLVIFAILIYVPFYFIVKLIFSRTGGNESHREVMIESIFLIYIVFLAFLPLIALIWLFSVQVLIIFASFDLPVVIRKLFFLPGWLILSLVLVFMFRKFCHYGFFKIDRLLTIKMSIDKDKYTSLLKKLYEEIYPQTIISRFFLPKLEKRIELLDKLVPTKKQGRMNWFSRAWHSGAIRYSSLLSLCFLLYFAFYLCLLNNPTLTQNQIANKNPGFNNNFLKMMRPPGNRMPNFNLNALRPPPPPLPAINPGSKAPEAPLNPNSNNPPPINNFQRPAFNMNKLFKPPANMGFKGNKDLQKK
jgi:hypothetical protein